MSHAPRLVVVEDDVFVQGLVCTAAAELGLACAGARGEEEFREAFEASGAQALYLDLQLASGDAIEVLRYLAGHRVRLPILLASGRDPRTVAAVACEARALGLEVAGTLLKPFDRGALDAALQLLLPTRVRLDPNLVGRAVARGDVELEFEPRVDLREGRVIDLRAHACSLGEQSGPGERVAHTELVEAAEALELGRPLFEHVLRRSLGYAGHWRRQGLEVGVCVEAGFEDLLDVHLADRALDALGDHGVPAERLRLVARPRDLLRHEGTVAQTLTRLRIHGVRTDLDAFGGAAAPMGLLWRLPFDGVLLDGGLVEAARLGREPLEVLQATLARCRRLGLSTCVRELGSRATLDWARHQGCERAQGRPLCERLPADLVPDWVRAWGERESRPAV
ncbi:MAG TPA: EAL domain-containing protein [Planctomycetota bacterium]|nr:EAL domain-containing protein [Planctomycetota bacterium]